MWVVQGIAEFFAGVAGAARAHRGLTILMGILGFVAGVVVLTYPIESVLALACGSSACGSRSTARMQVAAAARRAAPPRRRPAR